MTEIIEIKRKEFAVLEKLGENSFKVERKGKLYFLRKYPNKDEFREFVEQQHRLKITAIDIPKVYLFDKNQMISVVDFIKGPTALEMLLANNELDESIYKTILSDEWYGRREKLRIDFHPDNFRYNGKKLVYLPFKYKGFESDYNFVMKDFKLWFVTKEFVEYAESKGYTVEKSRIENEYALNKKMALMTVKYYI